MDFQVPTFYPRDGDSSASEINSPASLSLFNCIIAPIASNTIEDVVHIEEPLCDIVVCTDLLIAPFAVVDNHASTLSNSLLSESETISAFRTLSSDLVDPAEAHPLCDSVSESVVIPEQLICSMTVDYILLFANCFHACIFQLHLIENLEINCVIAYITDLRYCNGQLVSVRLHDVELFAFVKVHDYNVLLMQM